MNDEFNDDYTFADPHNPHTPLTGLSQWGGGGAGWFDSVRHLWQWDELAAEIGQESQSRVAFVGLTGAGKSLLFNRLRGWVVSDAPQAAESNQFGMTSDLALESLGLFVLADLPAANGSANPLLGPDLLLSLGDPALVVYLLDGEAGVRPDDFRWVAALRTGGRPLLVALNKIDIITDSAARLEEASHKLGMPVIALSAKTGMNVEEGLLTAMLDASPRLAVPLGREIMSLRRVAARRVIRQAAILSGLMGAQPVPMLDIPLQAVVQVGVVMRVGAAYGYTPTGGMNKEVMGTVVSTLGLRFLVLALVKFIPFVGSIVSGVLCGVMTYFLGEAAIRYYEAGATVPLRDFLRLTGVRHWLGQKTGAARQKLRRPRWVRAKPASEDDVVEQEIPVTEFVPIENGDEREGQTAVFTPQLVSEIEDIPMEDAR
jgi:uncharacterized protein (DUF697 family)/GTP-binding protein EngB required for normal cell division